MTEIVIIGNTNPIPFTLDTPIENKDFSLKVGLKKIAFSYTIPNIDSHNNVFRYSFDGTSYFELYIQPGAYEMDGILNILKNKIIDRDRDTQLRYFKIEASEGSMRTVINIISTTFKIDFSCPNSLGQIFGFTSLLEYGKEHISENIIMINSINSIFVHCSMINGALINGIRSKIIYEFSPDVFHGYLINKEVVGPHYYSVSESRIDRVKVWFTDENNTLLNMNEEEVVVRLELVHSPIK